MKVICINDPSLAKAFARAIQLPLPHWTFRALTQRECPEELGRGLTCNLSDYQTTRTIS